MKKSKFVNVFWGVSLLAGAALIVMHIFDLLGDVGFWPLLITIPFAATFIFNAIRMKWGEMFLDAGILIFIWRRPIENALDITISIWALIALVILLSIAFHILFKKKQSKWNFVKTGKGQWEVNGAKGAPKEDVSGENVLIKGSFSGSSKYITSKNLKYVEISNEFGGMEVYFDGAELAPEGAIVDVHNKFGGVELYVPRRWNIVTDIASFAGGVDCPRHSDDPNAPTITIRGNNNFGGVDIILV
ncbi:MAG: cell wall-active antibiotics response protein [Oscillospiraceae bacterium]|nr:cell wall-active antibiotics response protein [Oscillospiraceae bacterium]MCL2213527.1 cell wall-active antibiotics response protein [Oscillospiraceae bacterium]